MHCRCPRKKHKLSLAHFCPDARKYYDLEHLWADAEPVELADLLEEADAPLTGPEA